MAATIERGGFDIIVWSRDAGKAGRVGRSIGVPVAASAAEAAAKADVIVTSLADDEAVRAVYLGPDGIVAGIEPESIAVDTSTIDPTTSLEVGDAVEATGAGFLDCPVSGSVSGVESGTLTLMVGGEPDVLEQTRPVLEAIASRIVHTGGRGSGAATKLAVNALVHSLNIALCEAIVLAERAGVDRSIAYDVFASGSGGAPYVHYKRDAFENPSISPIAFSIDLVAKDLELITALGEKVGARLDQAATGLEIVRRAIADGFGPRDLSAIAVYLRGESA